jgi:UDP-N-acetylmuramoyl-L-alanyl-D-glutamate--2,6-diaminopimelate ligase
MWTLREILPPSVMDHFPQYQDIKISKVSNKSQDVVPGCLFLWKASQKVPQNTQYGTKAANKGAHVIIVDGSIPIEDLKKDFPHIIWIKTHEIQNIKSASMGTLGLHSNHPTPSLPEVSLTSPDAMICHEVLHKCAENGITHVAMEASSHGLDQHRLDHVPFEVGAFTSFSQDHLDYHGTMDDYFRAKRRLFEDLIIPQGTAVLNIDDPLIASLVPVSQSRGLQVVTYGCDEGDITLKKIEIKETGQEIDFTIKGRHYHVFLPLLGTFQAMNVLCALAIVIASGTDESEAIKGLQGIKSVPGRMEHVLIDGQKSGVFVDYAHTPDGLETALKSLRTHTPGKVFVVFGCGGDRDQSKRPIMGKIAEQYADCIIVTDDNPRTEEPEKIRQHILWACSRGQEIPHREEAIAFALKNMGPEDTCLIAGKGHEQGQIIGDKILPFDDRVMARKYLQHLSHE